MDAGIIGGVLAMPDFQRFVRSLFTNLEIDSLFKREFGLLDADPSAAADLSGNLVTTMQAGAVAGALVCSPVADRWGRKPSLLAVAMTGFVGGLLQAFSFGHLPAFYVGR